MGNKIYRTERIDHLGIVAGICNRIGLIERIDAEVGKTKRKVSVGQAVQAMVLNGLGFVGRPLYLTPEFFAGKPVDRLIGPDITDEDLNDDSLGRALDQLYESGVTEIFAAVVAPSLKLFGIDERFRHLDSTTFSLHGTYEGAHDEGAVQITHGYSKDHRPDLKQVMLALICTHQSAIPTWLKVLDGNQQDKESFPAIIHAYREQLEESEELYFIADSALYSHTNLQRLSQVYWLTRVPATLKAVKELYAQVSPADMWDGPEPGYRFLPLCSQYGGVAQRWVLVFSQVAYASQMKTLKRQIVQEKERATQALTRLTNTEFESPDKAMQALEQTQKSWRFHFIQAEEELLSVPHYNQPGRPRADQTPDYTTWQIRGTLMADSEAITAHRQTKGKFVLATNQLDSDLLTAQKMISAYKTEGVSAERGFRFLKDPLFFAHSLFLEKPERIMALLMIMGLSLLIYALAERHLREQFRTQNQTIPNQVGKPTQRPTMRRIFQIFEGIDFLLIQDPDQPNSPPKRQIVNLTPVHRQILALLGPEVRYCYQP